jgi:hypothetical protein
MPDQRGLRCRVKYTCKKPPPEGIDYADRGSHFVVAYMDFTAENGAMVVCLLHILFIDYAHFVCKKVAFLKNPASSFPFVKWKRITKIESKNFEHLPLGSGKVLEANVGTFAEADFPPESVESRDEILQRISH